MALECKAWLPGSFSAADQFGAYTFGEVRQKILEYVHGPPMRPDVADRLGAALNTTTMPRPDRPRPPSRDERVAVPARALSLQARRPQVRGGHEADQGLLQRVAHSEPQVGARDEARSAH